MCVEEMSRRYGFHFSSLIAVIIFMIAGYSPMLSVFYSTIMCFVLIGLTPETALAPRPLLIALVIIGIPVFWLFDNPMIILFALAFLGILGMNRVRPETKVTT